jgi:hypothetical protein
MLTLNTGEITYYAMTLLIMTILITLNTSNVTYYEIT